MRTPIVDFVKEYHEKGMSRFHMPGHKGCSFFGPEPYDITEIKGADSLYEADGIIAESENNATKLFGSGKTVFSTEGSSQCIRAMLYLAIQASDREGRPYVIAARNAHKSFLYAAALLDFDVIWLWPKEMHSLLSCQIDYEQLENILQEKNEPPAAVYVTSPDYLGGQHDIKTLAGFCHQNHTYLLVDNAHGAYHHFTEEKTHPMDLGADMCCDSAHKTLPVLTGGAYLHLGQEAARRVGSQVKQAMALFGSTSPSYLILSSLDVCNEYLDGSYKEELKAVCEEVRKVKETLEEKGWKLEKTEPLKITIKSPEGLTGEMLADRLRTAKIECEYADRDYVILMITPQNRPEELAGLAEALGENKLPYVEKETMEPVRLRQAMSVRKAIFGQQETILAGDACGRICGAPTVACPPAVPIAVSGEIIDENAVKMFEYYGITEVDVIKEIIRWEL